MAPFKLPVTRQGGTLEAADGYLVALVEAADDHEVAFIVQAINNVPLHAALAAYYAANEAQDANRLYEARKTIHHLLEQA